MSWRWYAALAYFDVVAGGILAGGSRNPIVCALGAILLVLGGVFAYRADLLRAGRLRP